jgi:hypothetical protein
MSKILFAAVAVLFILASCEDDSVMVIEPIVESPLYGIWQYDYSENGDSLFYEIEIDELKGEVAGTGKLYSRREIDYSGSLVTEKTEMQGVITGKLLENDSLYLNFTDDTTYYFEGIFLEMEKEIRGKIELVNAGDGEEVYKDIILEKQ